MDEFIVMLQKEALFRPLTETEQGIVNIYNKTITLKADNKRLREENEAIRKKIRGNKMADEEIQIHIAIENIIKLRKKYGTFDKAALKLVRGAFEARGLIFEDFEVSQKYTDSGDLRTCYFKLKNGSV